MGIPDELNELLFTGVLFWIAVGLDFLFVASTIFSVLYCVVMFVAALAVRKIQRYPCIIPFIAAISLIAAISPAGSVAASIWKGLFSLAVSQSSARWFPIVPLFLWSAVAIAALIRFVFAYLKVSLVVRSGNPVEDRTALSQAITAILPTGKVHLIEAETDSPAAWGILRKRILVPSDFVGTHSEEERVQIYLHELSHHRNGDVLWTLAANACGCIFWFHPIVLRAIASFLESLEVACDWRLVSRYGVDAITYSRAILNMQAGFTRKTLFPYFPGGGNEVRTRIFYLNDCVSRSHGLRSAYFPALLCIAMGLTLAFAYGKEVPGNFDAFAMDLNVEIPDGTERKLDVTFYWNGAMAIFFFLGSITMINGISNSSSTQVNRNSESSSSRLTQLQSKFTGFNIFAKGYSSIEQAIYGEIDARKPGMNNILIDPKTLKKAEQDPKFAAKIEATLTEMKNFPNKSCPDGIIARGWIIGDDGGLGGCWHVGNTPRTETGVNEDSVEVSPEARAMLEKSQSSYKPFTLMEPEEYLVPGSDEEKKFKDFLKTVTTQKNDLMSRIKGIMGKKGLSLDGLGKMKIEVTDNGKIVVGGLRDAKAAKVLEKALNEDKSLAKDLMEFQYNEKELSKQIKKYTGCDLFQLTMTARGDINQDVRDHVVAQMPDCPPRDEFYWGLHFLGETANVVNANEVTALGFNGSIDFSGELTTMAEPEKNIKQSLEGLHKQIQEEFDAINQEAIAHAEAHGIPMDEEWKKNNILDVNNVKITIDNLGSVTIEGMLASVERLHDRGEEIVKKLANLMLNDYDENSYHRPAFTDASTHMLNQMAEELGMEDGMGWDSRVVAELAYGRVGDVRIESPQTEKKVTGELEDAVNKMIEDAGIKVSEKVRIELDDSGKIIATNLQEGTEEAENILALLEKLNEDLNNTKPLDRAAENASEENGGMTTREDQGLQAISNLLGKLKALRK